MGDSHTTATAAWGDRIAVETLHGVPFRMYTDRPRRVESLLALADRWGTRPHIIKDDRVVTFAELRRAVAAKASELVGLGVKDGDRIFVLGWNGPEWIVNFWACLAAGAIPVLANTWWSAKEVANGLALLSPALTLADATAAAKMPAGAKLGPWEISTSPVQVKALPRRLAGRGRHRADHFHLGYVWTTQSGCPVASRRARPPAHDAAGHEKAAAPSRRSRA